MKAKYYYQKLKAETYEALKSDAITFEIQKNIYLDIKTFFNDNMDLDYNAFLSAYNEKYGNIIKLHRENQKLKTMKIMYICGIIFIVSVGISILLALYLYADVFINLY